MKSNAYSSLARHYDQLGSADYEKMTSFISSRLSDIPSGVLVLDLACGTGSVTLRLSELGYDMIGVDSSEQMLSIAAAKRQNGILWSRQDMRSFELYGTVDAAVCCLDGINYLTRQEDVKACFARVSLFMNKGGIFVFDVSSMYKYKNIIAHNDFILEDGDVLCAWRNSYNEKTRICTMNLSFFEVSPNGLYRRTDECQRHRAYSVKRLKALLEETGFTVEGIYSDYTEQPHRDDDERICFTARKL